MLDDGNRASVAADVLCHPLLGNMQTLWFEG
jgi:hypothetical protein